MTLWEDHLTDQQRNSWMIAGPLWEITANSEDITAIHLPHFIDYQALKDLDPSLIRIAHFEEGSVSLELVSKVHPMRVVLENPKFSLMGVIVYCLSLIKPIPVNGLTMVYHFQEAADVTLHVYIIPDDPAMQEAIKLNEKGSRHIMKPPLVCSMYFGHDYLLKSTSKQVEITPTQGVKFCYVGSGQTINYYEVYSEKVNENIELWLYATNRETCLWKAKVRPADLSSRGDQTEADFQCDLINIDMDKPIKHILYNILSELTGSECKTFKWILQDLKVKDGYKNIPKGELEKADKCDLTDLLISSYPGGYAAEVMKNVLDAINKKDLAAKLNEEVQRGVNTSSTAT
ncbi:caspase recruitment domain-containing protein 8-like [Latimeria chalumnae]|uniref:caspase recruitment domain-containing protein 8-like n=1 Tax=Latimeria chalumnae TaxID=7897 RepID=UPI00313BA6FC